MSQIQSRSSRLDCSPSKAVISLHTDYVSGRNANFRKWSLSDRVRLSPDIKFTTSVEKKASRASAERQWRRKYKYQSVRDKLQDLAVYISILNESSNIRLMPELICFLFQVYIF